MPHGKRNKKEAKSSKSSSLPFNLEENLPYVYNFFIKKKYVGKLIGKHGNFIHYVQNSANVKINLTRLLDVDLQVCSISGGDVEKKLALQLIRQRFRDDEVSMVKISFIPSQIDGLETGVYYPFSISHIISPIHFFIQLCTNPNYKVLSSMYYNMQKRYASRRPDTLQSSEITGGTICAALIANTWCRATIIFVNEEVTVRLLDTGKSETVTRDCLIELLPEFMVLPYQAIECKLTNLKPVGGSHEWCAEATEFLINKTNVLEKVVQFIRYDIEDGKMEVNLIALNHRAMNYSCMKKELTKNNYAEFINNEHLESIKSEVVEANRSVDVAGA